MKKPYYVWACVRPVGSELFCCAATVEVENESEALSALSALKGFDVEAVFDSGYRTQEDFVSYQPWKFKLPSPKDNPFIRTGDKLWVTYDDNSQRRVAKVQYCGEDLLEGTGSGFVTNTNPGFEFEQNGRKVIAWKFANSDVIPPDMFTGPA